MMRTRRPKLSAVAQRSIKAAMEFHGDRDCRRCHGTGYCCVCIGGGVNGSEDPCRTCGGDGMCACARSRLQREAERDAGVRNHRLGERAKDAITKRAVELFKAHVGRGE